MDATDAETETDDPPPSAFLLLAQITMWSVMSLGVLGVMVVVLLTPH